MISHSHIPITWVHRLAMTLDVDVIIIVKSKCQFALPVEIIVINIWHQIQIQMLTNVAKNVVSTQNPNLVAFSALMSKFNRV